MTGELVFLKTKMALPKSCTGSVMVPVAPLVMMKLTPLSLSDSCLTSELVLLHVMMGVSTLIMTKSRKMDQSHAGDTLLCVTHIVTHARASLELFGV